MSKKQRGGLGRGLGALIPTAPPAGAGEGRPGGAGYPPMPPYDSGEQRAPSGEQAADAEAGPETAPVEAGSGEQPAGAGEATGGAGLASGDSASDEQMANGPAEAAEADAPGDAASENPAGGVSADHSAAGAGVAADDIAGSTAESTADDPDALRPVEGAHFAEVPIPAIRPNPKQPRTVFDEEALQELTHSIREFGVLQPIVVRQLDGDQYELVMGERRLRAAATAGLTTVPAIVRTTADDAMLRDALLENIHRAQLNPLEEAAAYQQLLEEFGATHDELASRIGRSRPQVSNTIRLLNLPVPVQRRVAAGIISAGHARALLSVDDSDVQEDLAGRIVAEGLSVRATEELVALHQHGHGAKKAARKATGPRITAPALAQLADRLSDAFDTRVKVDLGQRKGKITVEFATIDDLERIVGLMSGNAANAAKADQPSGPAAPGMDYVGWEPGPGSSSWSSGHVSDPGAWHDPIDD